MELIFLKPDNLYYGENLIYSYIILYIPIYDLYFDPYSFGEMSHKLPCPKRATIAGEGRRGASLNCHGGGFVTTAVGGLLKVKHPIYPLVN